MLGYELYTCALGVQRGWDVPEHSRGRLGQALQGEEREDSTVGWGQG